MAALANHSTNENENQFGLKKLWNNLSDFLHNAQLIPFIVAVSGYHYFQVLGSHDKPWTAAPTAIFLDLLHYRTVQQAVETKKPIWIVGAVLTTVVAYLFQFIFYARPGQGGEFLPIWQQLLFASVVPVGIAYMVMHHHENGQKVESTLQADYESAQDELSETQNQLNQIQAELAKLKETQTETQTQLNTAQADLRSTQAELSQTQTELKSTQVNLSKTQTNFTDAQDQIEELKQTQVELNQTQVDLSLAQENLSKAQAEIEELRAIQNIWGQLNPPTQAMAKLAAGVLTLDEAERAVAEAGGTSSRETIRRTAKKMNGVAG
ncbi:MAG: hypothetical protein AAF902_03585 [Chloroflexota bacterium]